MKILVDGDSCPRRIRDIIVRTAQKQKLETVFVANRPLDLPESPDIRLIPVSTEKGAADIYICANAGHEDLVITRDIPLARKLLEQEVTVINDRGTVFSMENIKERLSERNYMYELRTAGLVPRSKAGFGDRETRAFAAAFQKSLHSLISLRNGGIMDP
ncbi:MAG: DUF188 domain-containing protein [Spirochaetales bacterium]|nr:MAG: DUF188 domain-containing protein [Spirochaetales bacterium]